MYITLTSLTSLIGTQKCLFYVLLSTQIINTKITQINMTVSYCRQTNTSPFVYLSCHCRIGKNILSTSIHNCISLVSRDRELEILDYYYTNCTYYVTNGTEDRLNSFLHLVNPLFSITKRFKVILCFKMSDLFHFINDIIYYTLRSVCECWYIILKYKNERIRFISETFGLLILLFIFCSKIIFILFNNG